MGAHHYDTLIVGAGSAGAILAARLSEDPARSVCLLEAGPNYDHVEQLPAQARGFDFTDRPYAGPRLTSHEWQFIARATDQNPAMPVPRGRMIGGSSSINGVVFLRALQADLDGWAAMGNSEWSYDQCLPYYRKLESDWDFGGDDWHGASGPIPVSRAARENWMPPSAAFFEACSALGYPYAADMNRPDARGVGPIPTNYFKGVRHSSAVGYLFPSRPRANLDVLDNTVVHRVCTSGRRATGVQVLRDGAESEVITADEVILSAGAIGSPHLLLLSGIGPADHLRSLGVQPIVDLPSVGQHVRDHPFVLTVWDTFDAGAIDRRTGLPWQLQLRLSADRTRRDDGWMTMILSTLRDADGGRGFTMPCSLMYARSEGELRLQSAEPGAPPLIDFNYLSEPSDLDRLRTIVRLALEIGDNPAFDAIRAGLRHPAPTDVGSDAAIDDWIRRTITTGHHISCTCRMGEVVDQRGHVYGVDNLRVIDASIMPDCPSVNLNATVMMMAEKLAASRSRR